MPFSYNFLRIGFSVFTGKYTRFLVTTPVSVGVGSKIGQICGVFSSKDSKMHIFLTFLNGYIHPNNIKNNKIRFWGFAPNPTHLRGRRGRWQTLSTYPYGECCRLQGVKGKMHGYAPLTLHLRGVAKRSEADGAGNLSRLAKQPLAAWLLQVEATQRSVVRVQEVFPCTLPRGERVGNAPRC